MLFAYNETDKEIKLDYKVYNDGTVGTFEITVGDDPESMVVLTTKSKNIMDKVHKMRYPMTFERNPFVKRLVSKKAKCVYDAVDTDGHFDVECMDSEKDLGPDKVEQKKFMSRNMVMLVLKRGSRFYAGKGNQTCKPIIKYGKDYTVVMMLIKWHHWKDLKFPMDIKIKSADGEGHHKKIMFGVRETDKGVHVNCITAEEYNGSFPEFDVVSKNDREKHYNKDGNNEGGKGMRAKSSYTNRKPYIHSNKEGERPYTDKPKYKTSSPYGSMAHKDRKKEDFVTKSMKRIHDNSIYGMHPGKEPNRKFQNKNKGNTHRGRN